MSKIIPPTPEELAMVTDLLNSGYISAEDASPLLTGMEGKWLDKAEPPKHQPTVIEHGFTMEDLFKKGKT